MQAVYDPIGTDTDCIGSLRDPIRIIYYPIGSDTDCIRSYMGTIQTVYDPLRTRYKLYATL